MKCNVKLVLAVFVWFLPIALFANSNSPNQWLLANHLQAGDTVGLVSSAFRAPSNIDIQYAAERLNALGLKVKYGKNILKQDAYFAGTDQQRAQDVNQMFADPQVKAIFEIRGGWGSNRILPYLNYSLIKNNPKILIGFSDITSLLLAIYAKTGLVTFHGPVCVEPWPAFTVHYLQQILFSGKKVTFINPTEVNYTNDIIQTDYRITVIRPGIAEGELVGGNLSVITSMIGSGYLPRWRGKILFLEDTNEDYYKIDRMMAQLQMAGVLKQISGFVFGQCTDCTPGGEGSSTEMLGSLGLIDILNHYIKPLGIPAWSGAMIGHMPNMFTLPEGLPVTINAAQGTITLLQPAVK